MPLLSPDEWRIAEAIAGISHCNPFLPGRVELERKALGDAYVESGPVICARPGDRMEEVFGNVPAIRTLAERLTEAIRRALEDGHRATRAELVVYEDLALYRLYGQYMNLLDEWVTRSLDASDRGEVPFWREFEADFHRLFRIPGRALPSGYDPGMIFAGFYQIERAFLHIFRRIVGASMPAARLRAAAWESIFTRDMRRYIRVLHRRMGDVPTLITGPSGSGKELVARAIGLSCYIPFDPRSRRFVVGQADLYVPLNLAALAPTLIESELFGHVKGAFTTAHEDRDGWLTKCGEHGAVFLDEIGELDAGIQVKLLRVIESRVFQKVGSTETLAFRGKIIAATNRDLAAEIRAGRFRHDLFYRLCADQIATPSLAEQIADRPEDLPELVRFIAREIFGEKGAGDDDLRDEVDRLTAEVVAWIERGLPRDYGWPGNFRELGQCVRNVMVRGSYHPHPTSRDLDGHGAGPVAEVLRQVGGVVLSADELLGRYYALAYWRSGCNYKEAGRRLGVDWRVVRDRLDRAFLDRLRGTTDAPPA